jgi:outer membrane protein insertion porin family
LPWESFSSAGPAPISSAVFWIRERYRNQGYLQAEVTDVQTPFSEDHRWVTVTITISEGKQTRVGSVEVTGSDAALGERRVELALEVGKPFRSDALETGRRALLKRLAENGFVDAKVTTQVIPVGARGDVDVVDVQYRIEPGEQIRIGHIVVQGNTTCTTR